MKEFELAVQEAEAEDMEVDGSRPGDLEWTIKERDISGEITQEVLCHASRPNDGQLGYLLATTGRHSSMEEKVAGLINFFVAVCDEDTASYLTSRLLSRTDAFGLADVNEIMEWMIEEWSGKDTRSSSGASSSQRKGGQKSTRRTPALT